MPGIRYYADPSWQESVIPFVRQILTITDPDAIKWFFEGLPKGMPLPWSKWITPLSLWFILIMSVYLLSIFIMALVSKRWIEDERLAYSLTIAPGKLLKKNGNFPEIFRNKTFWAGMLLPVIVLSIKCLHTYFPLVPSLELNSSVKLFRGTSSLSFEVLFEVIGLIYFVSLDVSLSIWVFYLLLFMLSGFLNVTGISHASPEPWVFGGLATGYITMGAMLMMVFLMFWQERRFWKSALRERKNYPLVIPGAVCFLIIAGWLAFAGMKIHHSLVFTLLAFLTFVGITRVICQAGTPYARSGAVPAGMTINIFGSESLGPGGITTLGLTSPWACDLRTMVMASIANFIKLGHIFRIHMKKLITAGIVAIVLGLAGSAWIVIVVAYRYGAINLGGWQFTVYIPYTVNWVKEYILHPYGFGRYQFSFMGMGGFLYVLFWFVRTKLPFFPMHPIGLAVASTVPIIFTWFSIFLGWFLKFMILRYGGQKIYRNLQPFFIGMIAGAFLTGGIWMVIDFITGIVPATHPILGA